MKRPKRENYDNGVYGDISYNDRLERYTSYLENRLKEREQALRTHGVVGRSKQLVCDECNGWGYTVDENGRRKAHCTKCD